MCVCVCVADVVCSCCGLVHTLAVARQGGVVDPEKAKAIALAQANLLSLKLPSAQVSPSDLAKRLYIGNLYYDLKEEDIRNTFAPFGAIHSIDLSLEPGYADHISHLVQPVQTSSRVCLCGSAARSKGFCFLEYEGELIVCGDACMVMMSTRRFDECCRCARCRERCPSPQRHAAVEPNAEGMCPWPSRRHRRRVRLVPRLNSRQSTGWTTTPRQRASWRPQRRCSPWTRSYQEVRGVCDSIGNDGGCCGADAVNVLPAVCRPSACMLPASEWNSTASTSRSGKFVYAVVCIAKHSRLTAT